MRRGIWELHPGDALPGVYRLMPDRPTLVMTVPAEGKPFYGNEYHADDPVTQRLHVHIDALGINYRSLEGLKRCAAFCVACVLF